MTKQRVPACRECGGLTRATRENFLYTLAGDWGATVKGVEVVRCRGCGAHEVRIEQPIRLQRAIAAAVAHKRTRLAPPEITFLRTHLMMTGRALARTIGVTPAALSRWENGKDPIGAVPDRLLRAIVAMVDRDGCSLRIEDISAIEQGDGKPLRLVVMSGASGWVARAA